MTATTRLRVFLAGNAALYAGGAALFALRPDRTVRDLGRVGGAPPSDDGVWNALAVAYMATIATTAAAAAASDRSRRRGLLPVLLAGKVASSAMFVRQYVRTGARGYLVGVATDVPLAVATAAFALAASRESVPVAVS